MKTENATTKLKVQKLDDQLFKVTSDQAYWSNGDPICEIVALATDRLCSSYAQSILKSRGVRGVLVGCFSVVRKDIVNWARQAGVGQVETFAI